MARVAFAALALLDCAEADYFDRPIELGLPDGEHWPDLRPYPGVENGRILVTNNLDDTVSVLDLAAVGTNELQEVERVPVGLIPVEREGPHHLAADPSGELYYVGISNFVPGSGSGPHGVHGAGTADGHVLQIRASDNVQVGSVRVDRSPGDVRLTPDGRLLLASHFDLLRITETIESGGDESEMASRLALVDPATMTRQALVDLCPASHGIAVAPGGGTAYVSCLDDQIAVVDLEAEDHPVTRVPVLAQRGTVSAPFCYPYAMTISPSGDAVWVSCFSSGEVLRYDVASGAMDPDRSIQLPGPAAFGAFTLDGARMVVPFQAATGLAWVDPTTGEHEDVELPAELCQNAHVARFVDGDRWLLVVCEGDRSDPGSLLVIDPESREVTHSVPLGLFPDDIAILGGAG